MWNLFHNSKHRRAERRGLRRQAATWQVPNHFFPWRVATLRSWTIDDGDIVLQLPTAQDRFVAQWLTGAHCRLTLALLGGGAGGVASVHGIASQLRTGKFKIDSWDAGWWWSAALKDRELGGREMTFRKAAHDALRDKLRHKWRGMDLSMMPCCRQRPSADLRNEYEPMIFPDYPFTPRRFEVRPGIAMSFLDEGPRDGEVVVMLHGNPSWSFYWRHLVSGCRTGTAASCPTTWAWACRTGWTMGFGITAVRLHPAVAHDDLDAPLRHLGIDGPVTWRCTTGAG